MNRTVGETHMGLLRPVQVQPLETRIITLSVTVSHALLAVAPVVPAAQNQGSKSMLSTVDMTLSGKCAMSLSVVLLSITFESAPTTSEHDNQGVANCPPQSTQPHCPRTIWELLEHPRLALI